MLIDGVIANMGDTMLRKNFAQTRFYSPAEIAEKLSMNPQVILRKIKAGELEGYKVGKDWKIEEGKVWEWLEKNSSKNSLGEREQVIRNFFVNGRLKNLPSSKQKRRYVLEQILKGFEKNRVYNEREVNEIIERTYPDFCTIRRELAASGMMTRKGGKYKVATSYRHPSESFRDTPQL